MRVLYIERSVAREHPVFGQIVSLGKHVECHTVAVQVGDAAELDAPGVTNSRCPNFPKLEFVKGWLFVNAARRAARTLMAEQRFDLLHAHFAYPSGMAARQLSAEFGVPFICTGRGDDVLVYPHTTRYLKRQVSQTLRQCHGFIGLSAHMCSKAIELGARGERCLMQPEGILDGVFTPLDDVERDPNLIFFAGTLLPVKNVMRMIEAMTIVADKKPQAKLLIAGEGTLEGAMRSLIAKNGIGDRCQFLGQISPTEIADIMRRAALFLLPSISESWGNVITEAMACGTPSVAARVGGVPEQITDDSYGLLCDPASVSDIADKILAALDKEWDRERLAARGGALTHSEVAAKTAAFYEEILRLEQGRQEPLPVDELDA